MTNFDTVREALGALIKRDQINTCQHDNTHRGGSIWEICDDCGMKWADDRGGKPKWEDPPEWEAADKALAALAELERAHYTAEDVADASAQGFRDGVASVTAGQEPVAWQRRMKPVWGDRDYLWSPWEECSEGTAEDCWKTPLLHEWAYEARALYTAVPVDQRPRAKEIGEADLDPDEGDPVTLWAEIWRLREAVKGPDGYATWQDAATAERIRRVRAESKHAAPVAQQPQAEAAPMSQPNRLIAYSAAAKLRGLGYQWDEEAEAWAPQQVEAVPPGYVLVPVEPTEEMHRAAVKAIVRCTGNDDFPPAVWGAMLAAAPKGQP